MIRIKHVYSETCKHCDFAVPTFVMILKIIWQYNATAKKISNFILNHPENKLIEKSTFITNNKYVSMPKREKISIPQKKMSTYLEINLLTCLPRIIINHQFLSTLLPKQYPIKFLTVQKLKIRF